jgi:hypothetical protein
MKTDNPSNQLGTTLVGVALLAILLFPCSLAAGPPFRTDDPEPVEYHHWEFYGASQITSGTDGISGTAPHVEINYGILRQVQVHVIVPMAFNRPRTGPFAYGPGDVELGLKFRFINETAALPQAGIFPLLEIPSGNAGKGLGAGNAQLFIPVWLQKSWGPWTTYGGGGYLANVASDPVNSWFIGWEAQRDFSKALTLGGEIFGTVVPSQRADNELAFTIGAIVNFSEDHHLLFSAGRDIVGHNDFMFYAAYQLTIGPAQK